MSELTPDRWLYGELTSDATLAAAIGTRVFSDVAPDDVTFPLVILVQLADPAVRGVGPAVIMSSGVYAVKFCGKGVPFSALEPLADRARTVLHAAAGSVTGGAVIGCVYQGRSRLTEIIEGVAYRQLIQTYRIYSQ